MKNCPGVQGNLNWMPGYILYASFPSIANHLICILINIYENIKNVIHEWGYIYKINNISAAFSHRLLKVVLNES